MSKRFTFTLVLISFIASYALTQGTQLLREPTLSATHIVFVYADDLWISDRDGGDAVRLTSYEGTESHPHFSDDGKWIAFSGQYEGNTDVYLVAAEGGSPKRITYHPGADIVQGWTADNKILFRTGRNARPTVTSELFTIGVGDVSPVQINVPRAAYGEISPDGKYAAYVPFTSWDAEWRNYRGGQAYPIWIQDLKTGALMTPPQLDGERHVHPVWIGNTVYYISERDYVANIWSYDIIDKTEKQITNHKRFDIKSIDAHGNDLIYEQGGYLHLIANGGASKQLDITVEGDMNFAIPRWESVGGRDLDNAQLSPNGKRAIFEYRGELLTVPKKDGAIRNLTNTSGVADRYPIWSPKGDQVAWFNDASGEYKLTVADQYGKVGRVYDIPAKKFYFTPDWAPDGSKIAFSDTDYNIWSLDLATGTVTKVDTDSYAHPNRTMNPTWSPDSRYIAYAKQQHSHFKSLYIYDTESQQTHQVVDGLADIVSPVFDQSGDYIYYLASTDYGLASGWLDMSSYDPSTTRTLYATTLYKDVKSPFLPKSDEEELKKEDEDKDEKEDDDKKDKKDVKDKEEKKAKAIDFEGIQNRAIPISAVDGEFLGLEKGPKGKVMIVKSGDDAVEVHTYDFEKQKLELFSAGVSNFKSNSSGSHAVWSKGGSWFISALAGKPNMEDDGLNTNTKVKVDPREEYKQIFKEGWRYMRDFLYVDNVHGAPWDKVWEWYSPWIDHVRHRTDLNYVVDIMSGEVAIGHSYVSGGDMPDVDRVGVGLLGADYNIENGLYRIAKIYTGEQWNPDANAPLSQPGLEVNEGDYISSVNGRSLHSAMSIYSLFEETVGDQVRLGLKSTPTGEERIVTVVPVGNEYGLRTFNWMEQNRLKVDELSGGKLAYVWVPNTGGGGFTNFNRYYFSQQDKKGAVIDERNNGGGSAADYMIDVLAREPIGYFNSKANDRRPWTTPMAGIWGPKVMIINERAGSGGDLLPYMFKLKELGPLVGTRTWGGLVGTWDTPRFIDGGRMVAPRGGFFDLNGEWAVEATGVAPDIEVFQDPAAVLQGRDPQLEKAVEEAMRLLKTQEFEMKPEPAAPIRSMRPAGWDQE